MQRNTNKVELALINGKIITCDESDTIAEAVAVKDGAVVAVTENSAVRKLVGPSTRVIDLEGKTVTPGFIDTHNHSANTGLIDQYSLDLSYPAVKSIRQIVSLISDRVSHVSKGEWIMGRGWNESLLEENRYVTKSDIDPVSPANPVMLMHTSGHYLTTNTLGLRISGIGRETIPPLGCTIVTENEEPNGILKEQSAMNLLLRHIPPWTIGQIESSIKLMADKWVREGVTTIKDCGVYGDCQPYLEAYENLDRRSELKVRTSFAYAALSLETLIGFVDRLKRPTSQRLRLGTVKIFLDGSCLSRTALMHDDWNKDYTDLDPSNKGYPVIDIAELERIVEFANDAELQVSIHAIGDRAIDVALGAIGKALFKKPGGRRHTLVHAILPTSEAIDEMRRLGVAVETQSVFLYFLGDGYAANLGPRRVHRAIPLKSMIKNGVIVGNGSDTDVCPLAPRLGLWSACVRRPLKGTYGEQPFGMDEALTVKEALRTYTIDASRCLGWEDRIGSVEVGKYADLVVWSDDLYGVPIEAIRDLSVLMTIIGGEIVYQAA